jgi:predicted lipoprotein with Yx(FWY)xxD motif
MWAVRSSFVRRAGMASVVLACAALVVAGCSSSSSKSVTAGAATAAGATVLVGSNGVLTDAKGLTLYTFASDPAGAKTSACTGACAQAWPALTTTGTPKAGAGVTGTLATIAGGQVTWDGHPLYLWMGDKAPGNITGDGINGFHVAKLSAGGGTGPATSAQPASGGGGGGY